MHTFKSAFRNKYFGARAAKAPTIRRSYGNFFLLHALMEVRQDLHRSVCVSSGRHARGCVSFSRATKTNATGMCKIAKSQRKHKQENWQCKKERRATLRDRKRPRANKKKGATAAAQAAYTEKKETSHSNQKSGRKPKERK